MKRVFNIFCIIVTFFASEKAFSQDVQAWIDSYLVKPLGYFEYEANIGYNKLVQENGWQEYYFCNTVGYQKVNWYLIEGSFELHETKDPQTADMRELRLFLGQRFNFTNYIEKIHLQLPYFYMRVEQRFLSYPDDGTTDEKTRLRARLGGRFLLNNRYIAAKTFYIPFYVEYFWNLNGEATERFASRNRVVTGLGYAITQKFRTELMYYGQRSRNTIEESFVKSDMIFQLNLRYYFLKGVD